MRQGWSEGGAAKGLERGGWIRGKAGAGKGKVIPVGIAIP